MKYTKNSVGSNQFVTKSKSWVSQVWNRFVSWFTRLFIKATKVAFVFTALSWSIFGAFQYGKMNAPVVVKAQEVVREIPVLDSPVLARIAKCESGGSQYDKTGQVLIKINTNNTVDIGEFQINSVWKTTASKLGYDLTKKEDNEAFAQWLYLNKGTQMWYSSAKCWDK